MKKIRSILLWIIIPALIAVVGIACKISPTNGAFLEVNTEHCVGCGKCVTVCSYNAISVINNKAVIDPSKCEHCLKCVKECPYDAIQ